MWYQEHLRLGDVLLLILSFVRSIHFNSLFFILFSMYILHCLVFWCCLEYIQKINRLNLRSTLVLAFLWFKFYISTLESCFCVDFRFNHFPVIIFLYWTFKSKFYSKILIIKKTQKSKCKSLNPCCLRVMFGHSNCHIMF